MSTTGAPKAKVRYEAQGETLKRFGESKAFVQILRGPLAGGKTKAVIVKCLEMLCQQKPDARGVRKSRVGVIRNTYPDLTTTTIRDWVEVIPTALGPLSKGHPPEHTLDFALPDGTTVKAEIIFLALDRPDDVKKLRGTQFTFVWINEMKEIPKAIFDMCTGRVDRYPAPQWSPWVGIFGDTNAWDDDHWLNTLYELWQKGSLPDYEFFVQPGAVMKENGKWVINPGAENLGVVGEQYYLRQLGGKKESYIRVNLANEVGLHFDGRPVHENFSDTTHTAHEDFSPVPGQVWVGVDHGLTPSVAFAQKVNGQWRVFDEIIGINVGAENFAPDIKERVAYWNAVCGGLDYNFRGDPSGDERAQSDESTVFRVYRANGIMMLPASTTNDVSLRRGALERPLTRMINGKPGIIFSPRCKKLRKGLAGAFCYKRVQVAGDERFRDIPDKNEYSHVVEALEYALLAAGENSVIAPPSPGPARAVRQTQPAAMSWNPLNV